MFNARSVVSKTLLFVNHEEMRRCQQCKKKLRLEMMQESLFAVDLIQVFSAVRSENKMV